MSNQLLEKLIDALEPFAKQQLVKYGSSYPYAAVVNAKDDIELVSVHTGIEHPSLEDLIREIDKIVLNKSQDKSIQVAAICYAVVIKLPTGEKKDAIQFDMEQDHGKPISVFLPYVLNGRKVEYDEMFTHLKDRRWFRCQG